MKTLGIVAHSAEGGSLCFLTACREGAVHLGAHMHPTIVMSAVPMGLSMPAWEASDHATIGRFLTQGVQQVADAGAHFYVCPDNTAHIVLEEIAADLPIPGIHVAEVVCREITSRKWRQVGLLGTNWTTGGRVYAKAMEKRGLKCLIPEESRREQLNTAIFDELCRTYFAQRQQTFSCRRSINCAAKGQNASSSAAPKSRSL